MGSGSHPLLPALFPWHRLRPVRALVYGAPESLLVQGSARLVRRSLPPKNSPGGGVAQSGYRVGHSGTSSGDRPLQEPMVLPSSRRSFDRASAPAGGSAGLSSPEEPAVPASGDERPALTPSADAVPSPPESWRYPMVIVHGWLRIEVRGEWVKVWGPWYGESEPYWHDPAQS